MFYHKKKWLGALMALGLLLAGCAVPGGSRQPEESQQVIAEGKALYEANCAACHGLQGEGQPNWRTQDEDGFFPAPPHDSSGHTWHHADEVILQVMAQGSGMPNTKMPQYEDVLTREEMEAILAYIKTFWGEQEREFQQQATQQWKEMNQQ